jgi:LmbE family N-acetylglucosaminyl deacetylase
VTEPATKQTTIVVSTHLDDAVFSCWSVIADSDREVTVVTVFTQAVPGIRGSWDALLDPSIDSLNRARERQDEDRAALALAGRTAIHLPFHDGQFGATDLVAIVAALRQMLHGVDVVYAPLAIWNAEHVLVREAVRRVRHQPRFYLDYPYALRWPVEPQQAPVGLLDAYTPRTVELDDAQVVTKLEAAHAYEGELARLTLPQLPFGAFATADSLRRETFFEPDPIDATSTSRLAR